MDTIGAAMGPELANLEFSATRLFYPLFCAVYHLKYKLPKLKAPRTKIRTSAYPKLKVALEDIDALIDRVEAAEEAHEDINLSAEERKFYDAFTVHWVHADKRTIMTQYICRRLVDALKA
jgi:hypothetical protein